MLKIRLIGDEVLREKTIPIEHVDDRLREFAFEMIETMHALNGIGLAAPQVGELIALLVIDITDIEENLDPDLQGPMVFINPRIIKKRGKSNYEEGCLSIPGVYANVSRPSWIKIEFTDLDGETYELETDGILARVLQHEIDHLNGVLFIDYLNATTREQAMLNLDLDLYNRLSTNGSKRQSTRKKRELSMHDA